MLRPEIAVLFTGAETTAAALATAGRLAGDHGGVIRLIVVRTVPFPLPLTEPAVPVGFTTQQVLRLVSNAGASTRIELYLCRDRQEVLRTQLPSRSWIVIGGKLRWWPTGEQRLAQWLQETGRHVIFVTPQSEEITKSTF
jgi:hypothetical protein